MDRLLLYGQRDSLLPATAAALFPSYDVDCLDPEDPFAALDTAPALLLIDAQGADWQPPALVAAMRRVQPEIPIVVVYDERRRTDATRVIEAGADAVLAAPFGLQEFAALLRRHLPSSAARATTAPGSTTPAAVEGSTPAPAQEETVKAPDAETARAAPKRPVSSSPPRTQPLAENGGHRENGNGHGKGPASAARMADLDALSLFVRGLAHEVNNPLTTIRGFLQLLLSDENGRPSDAAEAYRTMETESRRIAEVIQELEYFSGARRPARTIVDAVRLVDEILAELDLAQVVPIATAPSLPILADREQLSLGLRHLFGYLKSTAPEPAVELDVTLSRDHGALVVTATGRCSATASATPQQLLVPLYAGGAADGKRRSLACVFGIARAHGGTFEVSREAEEDRLTLRLLLPAEQTARAE